MVNDEILVLRERGQVLMLPLFHRLPREISWDKLSPAPVVLVNDLRSMLKSLQ